ncbi:MAG TPA: hypothetical protein VFF52_09865 [Isosphaeraceae bacterium]|nr:hypothetical protein [Isosphaeraceae bacterium]
MHAKKDRPRPRPEDEAVNWFLTLEIAAKRGDFEGAAEAQRELDRLGWRVQRKPDVTVTRRGGGR